MFTKYLAELTNNQEFLKYFSNTSFLLAEKILRLVVGLFVSIWVARYLGAEQFGLFSYAQSFVALFSAFATLGLNTIIVRELINDRHKKEAIIGTAFSLKIIAAAMVLLLLALAVNLTSNDSLTNTLIFIIASATVFQSFNVIDFYFQSKVLSKYIVYANVFSLLISSFTKVILIINNAPLIAFAYVVVIDSIILTAGFIYFYFKQGLSIKMWSFDYSLAKELLTDSWPLMLSGLAVSIYMQIDQVMIKSSLGTNAVGQYAAAIKLNEAFYFIPMVISSSLFPAIISAKKQNSALYHERTQKLCDLLVWIAISLALFFTFFNNWVIDTLYGTQYKESGTVFLIHAWSSIFVFLGVASSKWFVIENLQRQSLYRTLSGAIVNIMLNLSLIPHYGINGAAFATLISQGVASYLYNSSRKDLRVMFMMQSNAILLPLRKMGIKFNLTYE